MGVHLKTRLVVAAVLFGALMYAVPALAAPVSVEPGAATVDNFLPSTGCGCHGPLVTQWSSSMHAQAITDPVFVTKVTAAEEEVGAEVADFCRRCHSPIGNMIGDPQGTTTEVAAEGVTCMFCHQVVDVAEGPGNTGFFLEPDLTRRAQLQDPQAPHAAVYSELHTTAEFCGGCHNVSHPTNGTHLESTYAEWAEGPYAAQGVVCQDCHMAGVGSLVGPSTGTACSTGAERDNIFSMSFVGANVGQGPAEESAALLKRAATLELSTTDIVPAGSTSTVTVAITNSGAGHYLPTGLTEERDMWLEVTMEDENGEVVSLGERHFVTVLEGADGTFPVEMWNAVAVHSDDRIPPGETVTQEYEFEMPAGVESASVTAKLLYRSLSDELAGEAGVDNPVTEMAAGTQQVFVSQAAKDSAPTADEEGGASDTGGLPLWAILVLAGVVLAGAVFAVVKLVSKGGKKTE